MGHCWVEASPRWTHRRRSPSYRRTLVGLKLSHDHDLSDPLRCCRRTPVRLEQGLSTQTGTSNGISDGPCRLNRIPQLQSKQRIRCLSVVGKCLGSARDAFLPKRAELIVWCHTGERRRDTRRRVAEPSTHQSVSVSSFRLPSQVTTAKGEGRQSSETYLVIFHRPPGLEGVLTVDGNLIAVRPVEGSQWLNQSWLQTNPCRVEAESTGPRSRDGRVTDEPLSG